MPRSSCTPSSPIASASPIAVGRLPLHTLLRAIFIALAVFGGSACSFIYNLDSDQCTEDRDCDRFGDRVCKRGLCVERKPEVEAGPSGCTSNAQCIEERLDRPFICRDGECIDLYSDECPVVLHAENLKVPEPIIIGAYSSINPLNKTGSQITLAYDLALAEFTDEVGGLAGGPNNTRRKFVAVVCEGADVARAPIDKSLAHLVDTVQVKGVIASLFTDTLREAFDARGKPDNIFFVSPLGADSSLTSQDNAGLLWFMMGPDTDLAPVFVSLTKRAEAFQRAAAEMEESERIRVALVQGSLAPARDIAQVLLSDPNHALIFNGEKTLNNDDEDFLLVELTSDFEDDQAEAKGVIDKLSAFRPHVIVVTAGSEFTTKVLPVLEANWDSSDDGQVKPFYVTGPLLSADSALSSQSNLSVRQRLAGVNFTADADQSLFNMFKANFQAAYPDIMFLSTENFYDAAYYLLYAIAASGNPARLSGDSIAEGMLRIVSKSGTAMSVGPNSISDVLATLSVSNSRIALRGTMGPADFNLGTGARIAQGTVYCVASNGFRYDTLRLDPDSGDLEGTFPCFSGF